MENLKLNKEQFKEVFIRYMVYMSKCTRKEAIIEYEAIKDDLDIEVDECPMFVANECMECWHD